MLRPGEEREFVATFAPQNLGKGYLCLREVFELVDDASLENLSNLIIVFRVFEYL